MPDIGMGSGSSSTSSLETTSALSHQYTGILSRTFSTSSTVRWILPARVRSANKNDIVFVGETFVQLREFLPNGQLADATAKLDFGTQILAAQVVSAKLQIVEIMDEIIKQERDQEQYSLHGHPIDDSHPPQLLVLSTSSNELIYIYARENSSGDARFIFAKRSLLRGVNLPLRQCRHMAVDSDSNSTCSRALAIASSSGYIAIFKLHTVANIKRQIDDWDPQKHDTFLPWTEQRFIQIDGNILKMAFLRSSDSDPTKVFLLLMVASGVETHLLLYEWDTEAPLRSMKPMGCSGRPAKDDQFPLMLIPSTHPYSCFVVVQTGISYYQNVHSSEFKRIHCTFMGKAAGPLTWVHWAKPRRHEQYLQKSDDLVIVREDGLLQCFQIDKASSTKFTMNWTIGTLDIHVDTAFCMLAGPPSKGGDIVVAGGDMTEGGVFQVLARTGPTKQQNIVNVAPVHDMIIGSRGDATSSTGSQLERLDRIYLCGGRTKDHSHVTELRNGLEAQLGWTMPYPDPFDISRIWSLHIPWQKRLLLATSHSVSTNAVSFNLETQELESMDPESLPGFNFESPTLVIADIGNGHILQLTKDDINVIAEGDDSSIESCLQKKLNCLQADIFEGDNVVALVGKAINGYQIGLISIDTSNRHGVNYTPAPSPIVVQHEIIALCCMNIGDRRLVVVGTTTGKLLGYLVLENLTLKLAFETEVSEICVHVEIAPVASLVALDHHDSTPVLLLCGLRNGVMMCLELSADLNDRINIRSDNFHRLGQTTVQFSKEVVGAGTTGIPSVLVLCDSRLHRITLYPNDAAIDYALTTLYLANLSEPGLPLPEVNAIHRIAKLPPPFGEPGGLIVCSTRDELLFASLVAQEQTIITQLPLPAVPRRLLYSNHLKKLVVATEKRLRGSTAYAGDFGHATESHEQDDKGIPYVDMPKPVGSEERIQISLSIVDPEWRGDEMSSVSVPIVEDCNLRVTALMEWAIEQDITGKGNGLWIVMGLEQHVSNVETNIGRVIAINAKNIKKGHHSPQQRVLYRSVKGAIRALCAYGRSSLLIAAGNELILHNLDLTVKKWKTLATYTLPSAATSISCQGAMIFVATSHHSLIVLMERNDALFEHKSDSMARNLNNVVSFGGNCAMFSAFDTAGTHLMAFSGFDQESDDPVPMFRAILPLKIDRIRFRKGTDVTGGARHHFYGSTTDGTVYHFETLAPNEWRLLRFLEELSHFERDTIKAVPISKRTIDGKDALFHFPATKLSDMHVHGDRLRLMIEPGPYNLRNLFRTTQQREIFGKLAVAVIGETEYPVEAVVVWIRRFLQS
ncbi:hypothetical protein LTR84_010708 [Exophiala bonariae]|uniref:RSE1/DDB1/CPSF1 first beta-propeller domain-containing protein n=1 Tax=Exophiala bonariae TaxID=1690606 RepID=A0AAV9MSZ4_9EURO|nr:hypothetical protein LTR84_010708 [Exophiala bonariae]